jgi:hypothetical protein
VWYYIWNTGLFTCNIFILQHFYVSTCTHAWCIYFKNYWDIWKFHILFWGNFLLLQYMYNIKFTILTIFKEIKLTVIKCSYGVVQPWAPSISRAFISLSRSSAPPNSHSPPATPAPGDLCFYLCLLSNLPILGATRKLNHTVTLFLGLLYSLSTFSRLIMP